MTHLLPAVISRYFDAKNRQDIDLMLMQYADNAVVVDEGKRHIGKASIRAWLDETTAKYQPKVEVDDVSEDAGLAQILTTVSGAFPESPAKIYFDFRLEGDSIQQLACHA